MTAVAGPLPSPFLKVAKKLEEFMIAKPDQQPRRIVLSRDAWENLQNSRYGIYAGWIDLLKDPPTLCGVPIAILWDASDITVE
jgi:hypothetical protein